MGIESNMESISRENSQDMEENAGTDIFEYSHDFSDVIHQTPTFRSSSGHSDMEMYSGNNSTSEIPTLTSYKSTISPLIYNKPPQFPLKSSLSIVEESKDELDSEDSVHLCIQEEENSNQGSTTNINRTPRSTFSPMGEKDIMAKAAWIKCQTAAKKMLQEDSKDNTEGATHYRGKYEVKPSWLGTSKPHVQIGGLLFYKNIAPY